MRKKMHLLLAATMFCMMAMAQKQWMFIGTYTGSGSKGIYVYSFDPATGKADSVSSIMCENPSYLAVSSDGNYVYSVTENGGTDPGSVSAFAFDKINGTLKLLNTQLSGGDHPCYVTVDKAGKWVAVANYTGGSLSILRVNDDGSLQPAAQTIQHYGTGPVASRQEKPHVHMVSFTPEEKMLVANDLGTDKMTAYNYTPNDAQPLDSNAAIVIKLSAGSGPRHLAFHPTKSYVYVLEELAGKVSVHHFSKHNVSLIQTIDSDSTSSLPDKGSADIHFSADGKFLYTSNRGKANYITVYSVEPSTGRLTRLATQKVMGEGPRNFVIDNSDQYLLVANQKTDNIVMFKRDAATGLLTSTGFQLNIPKPVCIKMLNK